MAWSFKVPHERDPLSAIAVLATDVGDRDGVWIEHQTVILHGLAAHLSEDRQERIIGEIPETKKISIPGGPDGISNPGEEQERAFQDKTLRVS